ncbi:M20 metallopeptidase family protein [Desulfitibacter alkalitolerans]|uniref:M20 metallopeptidase family protein n=1 Tax=Desulfitibacter alkalitolerans TaxID=264641 RepID=UPI000489DADF|nr:amidohydrolase [Desulfitibacter alkalitolerans]
MYKNDVAKYTKELIDIRRDIHMHPELGYEEYRTSKLVSDYLLSCGIQVQRVTKTGVVGLLKGKKHGKTVMLRADMDALALQEMTNVTYKSKYDGKMHGCGHDGHTAMLLVAAKILSKYKDQINGNIKFIFQPNEETAGALDMIKEGVLDNPPVDAALCIHLWPYIPSGTIGITSGPIMAALEEFELTIYGMGGHTASPQEAIDPVIAASNIIQMVQTIQTREVSALSPTTIMFGRINGGTARNIVAGDVKLGGTIRYLYENEEIEKKQLLNRFERIITGICHAARTKYDLKYIPSNPALLNNSKIVEFVVNAAKDILGDTTKIVNYSCMAGEDFAEFSRMVPSAFYFLGSGNKDKGTDYPLHHQCFNIDEDVLPLGVEFHVKTAMSFLQKEN